MKKLDSAPLHGGIDETVSDISELHSQVERIQRAIRDFASLKDALKGKGGESIRTFYEEGHQPVLIQLHQSFTDYQFALKDLKDALLSFESFEDGFISEEFLENDVKQGLDKLKDISSVYTDEANAVLEDVTDIATFPKVDDSDFVATISDGKDKINNLIEELHIVDQYFASQLEDTEFTLELMHSYIDDLSSMFQRGGQTVENFDIKKLQELESFNQLNPQLKNSNDTELTAVFSEEIHEMPLSEIKKTKDSIIEQLPEERRAEVNQAFYLLQSGQISRSEFLDIAHGHLVASIEEGYPSDSFLKNLGHQLKMNSKDAVADTLVESLKASGVLVIQRTGDYVLKHGIRGPVGDNSFVIMDDELADKSRKMYTKGKWITRVAKGGGALLTGIGFGFGMHDDMTERDKTLGQAISHNSASLGVVALATAGVGAAVAGAPVAVAVGVAVGVGILAASAFEAVYDSNLFGLQDKLDDIGENIDGMINDIKESKIGQAVSSGFGKLKGAFGF